MKNLHDRYQMNCANGISTVLGTLIHKEGSAYRNPGAKMLIGEGGETCGILSGGCFDRDIVREALDVFATGTPKIISFDTHSTADIVFGSGAGCRGRIWIFLEILPADLEPDCRSMYLGALASDQTTLTFTITGAPEPVSTLIGQRFTSANDLMAIVPIDRCDLYPWIRRVMGQGRSEAKEFIVKGQGAWQIFADANRPVPQLHIIGGGIDAEPVYHIATLLGWTVHVYDHRPAMVDSKRFPRAESIRLIRPESFAKEFLPTPNSYVVVMTHNFLLDKDYLAYLLQLDLPYIGLLGPRARRNELIEELLSEGLSPKSPGLGCLRGPIGLPLGGDSPEAIALAIIAEIQSIATQLKPTEEIFPPASRTIDARDAHL